ncbi:hypothetical protein AAF712_008013 [Marasmius tenuissimus]|uniref:Major facilitator superfamily (MFS) profile domain-containing protein n=1 Tax=Marasmius tenuissimus TaxID=585030 RepID=A0ABR2ZUM4_9AGAR
MDDAKRGSKSFEKRNSNEGTVTVQPVEHDYDDSPKETSVAQNPHVPRPRSLLSSVAVIAATTFAMMANTANAASPAIALPTMQREFGVAETDLIWVMSAYPLSAGCLLLLCGRLADLYGRKRVFVIGSIWVLDAMVLSILRGLQGVGVSATIPASLGLLAETFPPSQLRSVAFASFAAGAPVGAGFGTILGGVLTEHTKTTWRAVFWFATGLTAVSLVLGVLAFDKDPPSTEKDRRTDWVGAFLSTAGFTLVVFVLGQGEVAKPSEWGTSYIIALLVVGVALIVAFVFWQWFLEQIQDARRSPPRSAWIPTPPPLMRVSLWSRAKGKVAVVMVIQFLLSAGFLGWQYWVILFFQNYQHYDAVGTIIRLIPGFISGVLCNVIVALVIGRLPLVILMAVGTVGTSVACLLFAVIDVDATYWAFGFPGAILAVLGSDFVMSSGTLFIAKVTPSHEQSVAGAVFQCMQQLGTSIGVTIGTVVFNRLLTKNAGGVIPPPRDAELKSYRAAQWTNFAFAISAALLAILFLRNVGIVGHRAVKSVAESIRRMSSQFDVESLHIPSSSAHPPAGAAGAMIPVGSLEPRNSSFFYEGEVLDLAPIRGKTETLLSALEEEQQNSQKLRAENAELRSRLSQFEQELNKLDGQVGDELRILLRKRKRDTREILKGENGELQERLSRVEGELKKMDDSLGMGLERLLSLSRHASMTSNPELRHSNSRRAVPQSLNVEQQLESYRQSIVEEQRYPPPETCPVPQVPAPASPPPRLRPHLPSTPPGLPQN